MKFDIVTVTYNSAKWIPRYFESLSKCYYNMSEVNIIIVDNKSTDSTLEILLEYQKSHFYNSFRIIENAKNVGFGKGNNIGFKEGTTEWVLFVNIDTEILPETFQKLEQEIMKSEQDVAVWELRQLPYEHPKYYDIQTQYTSWVSGAAFIIRREVYEQVRGFEEKIFMYGEDVDLSWKIRALGYKLKYCPHIPIIHYSYEQGSKLKPTQFIYSTISNSLLRYRYGNIKDILVGHVLAVANLMRPKPCDYKRRNFCVTYIKQMKNIPHFLKWRFGNEQDKEFKPQFIGLQYEGMREGAFYYCEQPEENPLVSIIIRTCQRADVLKEAIRSCVQQTYKNIEIIVIEDGEDEASEMLRNNFDECSINYYATGQRVGRSEAANIGMQKARGKYINFLDDDDMFYADHIEILVKALEENTNRVAYAMGEESQILVKSLNPYEYEEKNRSVFYNQKYNKALLFYHNYIPIQCVMFERDLFVEHGGLDISLEALEDWDLWVKYSCYTDFTYVPKVTSVYRIPYEVDKSIQRQKILDETKIKVRQKHKQYNIEYSSGDIGEDVEEILEMYKILKVKQIGKKVKNKYPKVFKSVIKIKNSIKKII